MSADNYKSFIIREGIKSDCKQIRRLIQELADFEKMPSGPKITAEVLEKDGFETQPSLFSCFVAEREEGGGLDGSELVGYALYYYTYSTWNGRKMFLEDLYVTQDCRGQQVGAGLFQRVAAKAVSEECAYLEFSVLSWNPARAFYEARGSVNVSKTDSWNTYRLSGEALLRTAQPSS